MVRKRWFWLVPLIPVAIVARFLWGIPSNRLVEAKNVPMAELYGAIPAALRFEAAPAGRSENAWPGLMAASEGARRLPIQATEALDRALHKRESLSDVATMATLEEVFRRYRGPMSLAVESVRRPSAWVEEVAGGANPAVTLRGLQTLTTLVGRRGTVRIAQGRTKEGLEDLVAALRIGERLYGSGGPIFYSSLGASLLARACREIRAATVNARLSRDDLGRLLESLPQSRKLREDFQRSIRSELHWFVGNEVARLRGPGGNSGVHAIEAERRRDVDSGWRELDIIASEVLRGHPMPYDRRQTIRDAWPIFYEWIENVDRPWSSQTSLDGPVRALVAEWPKVALSGARLGSERVMRAIEASRTALMKSSNPYGRLAIWFFIPVTEQNWTAPFRASVEVEATRLVLAIRIYERAHRRLPSRLEDLVETNVIETVPRDAFGDGALRFDSARRRVWSLGVNGIDEGGRADLGSALRSRDLVFELEPLTTVPVADETRVLAELEKRRQTRETPLSEGRRMSRGSDPLRG